MPAIFTRANVLPNKAVSVQYSVGRQYGAVMFDKDGEFYDCTCSRITRGRGFCRRCELPAGVYDAAKSARLAALARADSHDITRTEGVY